MSYYQENKKNLKIIEQLNGKIGQIMKVNEELNLKVRENESKIITIRD